MNRFFCLHTPGPYAELAKQCVESFAEFGLPVTLQEYEPPPNAKWIERCKARMSVLMVLAGLFADDGIGLLDADLTCVKEPVLLQYFNKLSNGNDVAVHDRVDQGRLPDDRCHRYCAGNIIFAPTDLGRACLRRWFELCEADPEPFIEFREQVYLHTAIEELRRDGLHVFNIGDRYNRVPERMTEGDDTVIIHQVASRQLRATHGGGI